MNLPIAIWVSIPHGKVVLTARNGRKPRPCRKHMHKGDPEWRCIKTDDDYVPNGEWCAPYLVIKQFATAGEPDAFALGVNCTGPGDHALTVTYLDRKTRTYVAVFADFEGENASPYFADVRARRKST